MKIITHKILKSWSPCADGYKVFCELFPKGAYLKDAGESLMMYGHPEWADWLWEKCAAQNDFREQTVVVAGNGGAAIAGRSGTAVVGRGGTAGAGGWGTAVVGKWGMAKVGERGISIAGEGGTAGAGEFGTIIINYWDVKKKHYRWKCAEVDGKKIKAGKKYRLGKKQQFVEVKE